jgi:hypothetical protein
MEALSIKDTRRFKLRMAFQLELYAFKVRTATIASPRPRPPPLASPLLSSLRPPPPLLLSSIMGEHDGYAPRDRCCYH